MPSGAAMIIKGFNVVSLLKSTVREVREDRIPSLAAETAYYFFFSLFPLLLFLTPLLGIVGNGQELMTSMVERLSTTMPEDSLSLLKRVLSEILTSSNGAGVMSVGVLLAGWSGSNIFGALTSALNVAYDVTETRPWWKQQLIRIGALLVAGAIMILATAIFLDGERFAQWAGSALGLGGAAVAAWTVLQLVLALALLVALGVVLFKLLPNVHQRWSHVVVASVVTTALWVAATLLFRLYVQHFASYNKTYGTIGGVIVLLTWMYYSMFVVLVSGELASELHHGSGAVEPTKGAVYYGRIVSDSGPGTPTLTKANR
ncbi:MAG TPA: YihY/virulence factor BrkB family protein [Gemmatimonadaceae bacterium]|nr:YihY/virulence factor BrkB family protein [Gemmatimonadaceae bacterium]